MGGPFALGSSSYDCMQRNVAEANSEGVKLNDDDVDCRNARLPAIVDESFQPRRWLLLHSLNKCYDAKYRRSRYTSRLHVFLST